MNQRVFRTWAFQPERRYDFGRTPICKRRHKSFDKIEAQVQKLLNQVLNNVDWKVYAGYLWPSGHERIWETDSFQMSVSREVFEDPNPIDRIWITFEWIARDTTKEFPHISFVFPTPKSWSRSIKLQLHDAEGTTKTVCQLADTLIEEWPKFKRVDFSKV